jgi:hypothetical protein
MAHPRPRDALAIYQHHAATRHPRAFYANVRKLEYVCAHCGLLLFEGPDFVDFTGGEEWRRYVFPRRCKGWLRNFARKVARQRN